MWKIIYILLVLTIIIGVTSYVSQSAWFVAMLASLIVVIIVLLSFFAGVYVARDLMQKGASIAINSASEKDKWDATKMAGMAQFGKEIIKVKMDSLAAGAQQQYQQLPPMTNVFDITDFESEEVEK